MLSLRCNRNLEDVAGTGGLKAAVYELVDTADAEDWIDKLVLCALAENPGNPKLRALYDEAWLTMDEDIPSRSSLESLIDPELEFLDVDAWLTTAQEMTGRVCRVERTSGGALGTGFLISPSCVLTNYHVVETFIGLSGGSAPLSFRFDFRVAPDGGQQEGKTLPAAQTDWLVSAAPYSPSDTNPHPAALPGEDELDYAVVRLRDRRGDSTGWIDIGTPSPEPTPGMALAILQHPQARPLKLALDTKAIIGFNANGTRLTYRTNTQHGSSGSPCFTLGWKPVALHHSGDPAAPAFPPQRNAGIPLRAIQRHLERTGRAGALVP
ncbi:Trypsin-like peptidase domain-containing protein [Geodermatophilus dictyosporus]|uniref:Trypsin-like peptidase domain-containing protein n=2 Tax=Geodermatophilus dictyosporus TaxID=1523247 RepID=A0A1I5TR43_9ACTN|nr:Trypsin-like peptidase domain-containing protein [Geodermatophilus dictyosporus]